MTNHPNRSRADRSAQNPTPDEIRAARAASGLSQTAAARLIYCTLRGWQEWEAGNRRMHPAMWELWRIKVRTVGLNMGIEELETAWNAQADRYNQWQELGIDEIVAFAQEVEREACARQSLQS